MKKYHLLVLVLLLAVVIAGAIFSDGLKSSRADNFSGINNAVPEISKIDGDENYVENEKIELARSGCCSWHGGVCGCDETTDRIICCDGTLSPTCTCSGY